MRCSSIAGWRRPVHRASETIAQTILGLPQYPKQQTMASNLTRSADARGPRPTTALLGGAVDWKRDRLVWPISTSLRRGRERPTPATGTFLAQWPLDFVSGRSQISPSKAEFGGSSRCRITTSDFGELQPNGRTSSRRQFAIDPQEPVAVFSASDRSTLEPDLRRSPRADQRWRQQPFAGDQHRPGEDAR
jgi:hypothetical protein